jgi:hypothetical protein
MKVLIAFLAALFLAACGGGGCDNCGANNVTVPLAAAELAIIQTGETDTMAVSGTVDGQVASGSATLTDTVPKLTTLNGVTVLETVETVTETRTEANGATVTVTESIDIFTNPDTGAIIEEDRSDGTVVTFPPYTLPTETAPGGGGILAEGTIYSDKNKTTVIGTEELSYSVEADTETDDKVTFEKKDKVNNGHAIRDEKKQYKIDNKGNGSFVSRVINGEDGGHNENLDENEQ